MRNKMKHLVTRMTEEFGGAGPQYPQVPLQHDEIRVAAVQMNPVPIDPKNPAKGIKANVDHMLYLCDAATLWPPDPHGLLKLIAFPEFSINGFDTAWTREDWLRICISLPGPETEALGAKAKELDCYICFANYCQDPDWPGHFSNMSVIIGPDGNIIHKHWKAYIGFPGLMEFGTTVHDVFDEFVERYGWEAVWPVAKTPIGNIGTYVCSEGFIPETARALTLNGAEILVRHIANGGAPFSSDYPGIGNPHHGFRAQCGANNVFGVYPNSTGSSVRIEGVPMVENAGGGSSMIVNEFGDVMNRAIDSREEIVQATIPIASFRKRHRLPLLRKELYAPVYGNLPPIIPPNLYSKYLPKDDLDAVEWTIKQAKARAGRTRETD